MKIFPKSCNPSTLFFSLTAITLFLTCTDLPTSVFDPDYTGDYNLEVIFDQQQFLAFQEYHVPINQGKDNYESFTAATVPTGGLDSGFFTYKQNADSLCFYFTREFSGDLVITANRPNSSADTFTFPITVESPFSISGNKTVTTADSFSYRTFQREDASAKDNIKRVYWYINNKRADSSRFESDVYFSFDTTGNHQLKALLVDFRGNSIESALMEIETVPINFTISSVTPDKHIFTSDDSVTLQVHLAGVKGDSVQFFWEIQGDTASVMVNFPEDTVSITISTLPGKTGILPLKSWLVIPGGIVSSPKNITVNVISVAPAVEFVFSGDTMYAPIEREITIYVSGDAHRYVWDLTGDSPDTTKTPAFTKTFFRDSTEAQVLNVYGINTEGAAGEEASLVLLPAHYSYVATFTDIPERIDTYEKTLLSAQAYNFQGEPIHGGVYKWLFSSESGDLILDTTVSGTGDISVIFTESSVVSVSMEFSDTRGQITAPIVVSIPVADSKASLTLRSEPGPHFSLTPFTIHFLLKENFRELTTLRYRLLKDTQSIVSDSLDVDTSNVSVAFTPQEPGTYTVEAWVVDEAGVYSDTIQMSILILDSRPAVSSVLRSPNSIHWGQTVELTIIAQPSLTESAIKEYYWNFGADEWDTTLTPSVKRIFRDKSVELTVQVRDRDGVKSAPYSTTLDIVEWSPGVESILLPDETLFAQKSFSVRITATDNPGGLIDSFLLSLTGADTVLTFGAQERDVVVVLENDQYGEYKLSAMVRDSTGQWSDEFGLPEPIVIQRDIPVVDGVVVCTQKKYIYSPFAVRVDAEDNAGGQIDSFAITLSLNDTAFTFVSKERDLNVVIDNFGEYTISAKVLNSNNNWSDEYTLSEKIVIDQGRPQILYFEPTDTIWWLNSARFRLSAKDPDGFLKKIIIDWGDGNQKKTDITQRTSSILRYVDHTYDSLAESGNFIVSIVGIDNNGFVSDTLKRNIAVSEGRPTVSITSSTFFYSYFDYYWDEYITKGDNDSLQTIFENDTLLIPYLHDELGRRIRVKANASTPNGSVAAYALSISDDTTGLEWNINNEFWFNTEETFTPNEPFKAVLFCKNNYGLVAADTFWVKAFRGPYYERSVWFDWDLNDSAIENQNVTLKWHVDAECDDCNYAIELSFNNTHDTKLLAKGKLTDAKIDNDHNSFKSYEEDVQFPWDEIDGNQDVLVTILVQNRFRQQAKAQIQLKINK